MNSAGLKNTDRFTDWHPVINMDVAALTVVVWKLLSVALIFVFFLLSLILLLFSSATPVTPAIQGGARI